MANERNNKKQQNNVSSGSCLAYVFMFLWPFLKDVPKYLEAAKVPEIVRLLCSLPSLGVICLLYSIRRPQSSNAPLKQKNRFNIWSFTGPLMMGGFLYYCWHSLYRDAASFQNDSRSGMTDNPNEELLVATILAAVLIFYGFWRGINTAKSDASEEDSRRLYPRLLNAASQVFLIPVSLTTLSFALYWPWPYMTDVSQSWFIATTPYSVPIGTGIAATVAFFTSYRRENNRKNAPVTPTRTVTLRVSGPRDALDISYTVQPRGKASQRNKLIALLPWELAVPATEGAYIAVEADPKRLATGREQTVTIQLLIDGKVVRENWASGQIVECHMVV